jgi:vitamin B12 transporter
MRIQISSCVWCALLPPVWVITGVAQSLQTTETMVVVGTAVPVPLAESSSSVLVTPVQPELLKIQTPIDLLRNDSSIFVEQRGAGGAQSDLVLRGGSFAQTLVLVNGFRINDSQSAHHNLDLPIPLEAMDTIQVLHGAGSTLHGADALAGVVDFLTAAPEAGSALFRAGVGSFGQNEQSLMVGGVRGHLSGRLTADRTFSTGFMVDRDYRNENASAEGWAGSRLGLTDLQFATSDRAFGANQFYGPFPSWERTKSWFASARQELGGRTVAALGYRRHTDKFVLIRTAPAIYENNHIDSSWQGSFRRTQLFGAGSALLVGIEADGDSIRSNNLGIHARNRGAGYADLDLHPRAHRWTASAGIREEVFSGGHSTLSPHLTGSWRLVKAFKIRASGGYGFRLPTYTDLYYSDPTTSGNPNLKPESAWSGEAGVDWAPSPRLALSTTGFYSRQHDAIDYVRTSPASRWQAVNLNGLRFAGVESSAAWQLARSHSVHLAWTSLFGAQNALNGLESEYVFNYPMQNVHATWNWAISHDISISNTVQIAQRYQRTPYPVWNAAVVRGRGMVRPYVRSENVSNTGYKELAGIAMPGRSIVGGVSIWLGR